MKTDQQTTSLFDQALDQIENQQESIDSILQQHPEHADQLRTELEAALWLRHHKDAFSARPAFLVESRTHLMGSLTTKRPSVFSSYLKGQGVHWAARNRFFEVLSLLTLLLCMVFVGHNVVLMADLSLPSEPLYPVKLLLEQGQRAITFNPEADARLQVDISHQRTIEIIELILNENYAAIPQAVKRLERQLAASQIALDKMQQRNPTVSEILRQDYQDRLSTETMILSILIDSYPSDAREYINLALLVTQNGLAALQD